MKVADTHVRHMRLLRRARGEQDIKPFNKDQLRRMLEVTVSPTNRVFMLVMKRGGAALRAGGLPRAISVATEIDPDSGAA